VTADDTCLIEAKKESTDRRDESGQASEDCRR
jgi:hypothetical protein